MTAADFRRTALKLPQAIEAEDMSHSDFRASARDRRRIYTSAPPQLEPAPAVQPKQ